MSVNALETIGVRRPDRVTSSGTARVAKATLRRTAARWGCALLVVVAVVVTIGPMLSSADPYSQRGPQFSAPGLAHWFGTDQFGRDLFARVAAGGARSLLGAIATLAVAAALGLLAGVGSSMLPRRADQAIMRVVDALNGLPPLVVPLALVAVLGASYVNLLVSLVIAYAPSYARLGRTFAEDVRSRLDVVSARLLGISTTRITLTHVLPSVTRQMLVIATLDVGSVIVALAGLSYLGLGAQPPTAEWGALLQDGQKFFAVAPWLLIAPATAICLTVVGFNLIGESVRDSVAEVEGR